MPMVTAILSVDQHIDLIGFFLNILHITYAEVPYIQQKETQPCFYHFKLSHLCVNVIALNLGGRVLFRIFWCQSFWSQIKPKLKLQESI